MVNYRDLQTNQLLNVLNLTLHEEDFGDPAAEWHFLVTAHGKSACEAPETGTMDKPAETLHWPNNDSKITLHLATNQHTKHELWVCYRTKFMEEEFYIYKTLNGYTNTWQ